VYLLAGRRAGPPYLHAVRCDWLVLPGPQLPDLRLPVLRLLVVCHYYRAVQRD
jgi:hypothetical protein